MNKLAPFTMNQKAWYDRCFTSWFNVAEGGKRGSKNVLATLAFCVLLEHHPDKIHLISGVSIATAKLNILDCNGYGMLNYFEGRCREGTYKNRDCIFVDTLTGEKIVLVSGGGKDGDNKLIQGNTYGMAYITEANLCHPSFIKEVFDRTLSSRDRKIFHDLNPKSPTHPYYTDVIDFHAKQQAKDPAYGYNYGHFTIADNMSISDERMRALLKTYDKNTVWYKRDILGLRIAAEGLIYKEFADTPEAFIIDKAPDIMFATIGVDFGGNGSAHAFICTGFTPRFENVVTLEEYYRKEIITPRQLENDFVDFVRLCQLRYKVVDIYCDSAEQVLIRGLRNAAVKARLKVNINNAVKGLIIDRIRLYNLLMSQGRYKIMRRCKHAAEALSSAQWDPKHDDARLDDGTVNVDSLDAQEYSTEKLMNTIMDMTLLR
ncbi:MAG: PBSX family phage terminase large subunit [Clostridia bacterium]|nr:PBSX family phage terminase large subunit [Clostridia bacterium]